MSHGAWTRGALSWAEKVWVTPGASNRGLGVADREESSMEEGARREGGRKAWERCGVSGH